jgi:hypothetical protein
VVIEIEAVTKLYKMGAEIVHALRGVGLKSAATNTSPSWGPPGPASPP